MFRMTVVLPSGKVFAYRVPSVDLVATMASKYHAGTRVLVHSGSTLVSDTTI